MDCLIISERRTDGIEGRINKMGLEVGRVEPSFALEENKKQKPQIIIFWNIDPFTSNLTTLLKQDNPEAEYFFVGFEPFNDAYLDHIKKSGIKPFCTGFWGDTGSVPKLFEYLEEYARKK